MKYIYLIRHGQSMGNLESDKTDIIHGIKNDTLLTPHGVKQIQQTAQLFGQIGHSESIQIHASPMKRTRESAHIIAQHLASTTTINVSELLSDINFGDFEGNTWKNVRAKYSDWFSARTQNKFTHMFPGGESPQDVQKRIRTFIHQNIFLSQNTNHIICTHEEVIRIALGCYHTDPMHYTNRKLFKLPNASVSIVVYNSDLPLVLQVGSDSLPPQQTNDNIFAVRDWYSKKTSRNPDYLQPRKNYSENKVFTVAIDTTKETVKCVPHENIVSFYKDAEIALHIKKLRIPTPDIISIDPFMQGIIVRRTYIHGKIAEHWLQNNSTAQIVAMLMGHVLRQLHESIPPDIIPQQDTASLDWDSFVRNWIYADLQILQSLQHPLYTQIAAYYSDQLARHTHHCNQITFLHNDFSTYNLAFNKYHERLLVSGIWDFERAFSGDPLWDLAVTRKISFFRERDELYQDFCLGYFGTKTTTTQAHTIAFYTLMNTTGAIRYKKEHQGNFQEEIINLAYIFQQDAYRI